MSPEPIYGYRTIPVADLPAIYTYGSAILTRVADPVVRFDDQLLEHARLMTAVLYRSNGLGLAAPQIGCNECLIVLAGDVVIGTNGHPAAFVNPMILEVSAESEEDMEGCLSFPRVVVPVRRPVWITVGAQTLKGKPFQVRAHGRYARVLYHECDHLNGKLIIDYAKPFKAQRIREQMNKFKRRLKRQ